MKRVIAKRPKNQHKILEDESQKLRAKLDNLKKQIEAKKKEKESHKNTPSRDSTGLSRSRKSNISNIEIQPQLNELLSQLNLEKISNKLKDKGIYTMDRFINISAQEVDNWRDIAVGYRIKIRKYIDKYHDSQKQSPELVPEKKIEPRDIQAIVKTRKEEQIFVPLNRKHEQQQYSENREELGEEEQEVMIQSLMKAFHRQTIPESKNLDREFDSQIESEQGSIEEVKLEKQKIPVKSIQKQNKTVWSGQALPDYNYCWLCLQMVKNKKLQHNNRHFCSESCLEKYQESTDSQEYNPLYSEVAEVEEKFNNYLQLRQSKAQAQPQYEEEVDFEIM